MSERASGMPQASRPSSEFLPGTGSTWETRTVPEPTASGASSRTSRKLTQAEQPAPALDEQRLVDLIAALERELAREDLPNSLRTRLASDLERMTDLRDAVQADNGQLIIELVDGTIRDDGTKRPDGLSQIVPRWARETAVLEALRGIVVVDESRDPVTVTVHWEQVPPKLRLEAASLASELVDAYRDRPKGGRPRKSREV